MSKYKHFIYFIFYLCGSITVSLQKALFSKLSVTTFLISTVLSSSLYFMCVFIVEKFLIEEENKVNIESITLEDYKDNDDEELIKNE
jgi:hypothetical protein